MLSLAAALAIIATQETPPSPPSAGQDDDIIVIARSVERWRKALAECVARRCPPNEDARASIRYASMLFVQGKDREARKIINASLDRNRRFAARYPRAVASLYRSNVRLAVNIGEPEDAKRYGNAIVRSLKAGLPDDSRDVLLGEIEIADLRAQSTRDGATYETLRMLRGIAKRASEAGLPDIAAMAVIRRAMVLEATGYGDDAAELLRPIAADQRPQMGSARRAALALLFQIERSRGEEGDTDALIANLRSAPGEQPILLHGGKPMHPQEFRVKPMRFEGRPVEESVTHRLPVHVGNRWADIGFWIRPNGRVADIEVLRGNQLDGWTKPIRRQLAERVYAPFEGDVGPGQYHVEHYRLTADFQETTGSRIRRRSAHPRYEVVDLTDPRFSGIRAVPIE